MPEEFTEIIWAAILGLIAIVGAAGKALARKSDTTSSNGSSGAGRIMDALAAIAKHTEQLTARIERIERSTDRIASVVARIETRADLIVELRSRIEELARLIDHFRQESSSRGQRADG